jgi:hypothetical protein
MKKKYICYCCRYIYKYSVVVDVVFLFSINSFYVSKFIYRSISRTLYNVYSFDFAASRLATSFLEQRKQQEYAFILYIFLFLFT